VTNQVNPPAGTAEVPAAGCLAPPASADPAQAVAAPSRRGFLRSSSMLSVSSLMGAGTLMAASSDAKAAVEWAEHFQKNYRLMTDEEKNESRLRLEKRYSQEYGKKVSVDTTPAQPGVLMGYALNIRKCIGCRRCVKACVEENNQSRGERPGERIEWIQVLRMERGEFTKDKMNQGYPEGLGIQVGGNAYSPAGQVLEGQYQYTPTRCPRPTPPTCPSPACSARSRPA
jgi:ferredoxin